MITEIAKARDITITIAEGSSRRSKRWINRDVSWLEFVDRLSQTIRTEETELEYNGMKKSERDEVKDVGGFVGCEVENESRAGDNIVYRSMIALDVDFVKDVQAFVKRVESLGYEAVVHSTHSHKRNRPRLRCLIPVSDKLMTPEKYAACSRFVADEIGFHFFDSCSFKSAQLMYWPSTPADGEYLFFHIEGRPVKTNGLLERYPEWRDAKTWPGDERENVMASVTKLSDPRDKPDYIGAFCRAYSVYDVLETFLADYYEPGDSSDRFTYVGGESTNGLTVHSNHFEGDFAYSYHDSDPANDGHAKNAFDLVRVHLFGELDADAPDGAKGNTLPSYQAMKEFVLKDNNVAKEKGKELFGEFIEDEKDLDFMSNLIFGKGNKLEKKIHNFEQIILNDPGLRGKIAYNEMTRKAHATGELPWKTDDSNQGLTDTDVAFLRNYIEKRYGIDHQNKLKDAFNMVLRQNSYHPLRDKLKSLVWDGTQRVETLLTDVFKAKDTKLNRSIIKMWMTAAVARVMEPGYKFDHVLILVGDQGIGKSQFFLRLSMERDYFMDGITAIRHGKDTTELLAGKWIIELGELSAMKGSDVEHVKSFITTDVDTYRVPYKSTPENFYRQCVFAGTTNRDDFLRDATGNRRFLPVRVYDNGSRLWELMTDEYVEQLWAEAFTFYKEGHRTYFDKIEDADIIEEVSEIQDNMTTKDGRLGMVQEFLETPVPRGWERLKLEERVSFFEKEGLDWSDTYVREKITGIEVFVECIGGRPSDYVGTPVYKVNDLLKSAGWEASENGKKTIPGHGRQRYYVKKSGTN